MFASPTPVPVEMSDPIEVRPDEMKSASGSMVVPRYPIRSANSEAFPSRTRSVPPYATRTGIPWCWKTPSIVIEQTVMIPTEPDGTRGWRSTTR